MASLTFLTILIINSTSSIITSNTKSFLLTKSYHFFLPHQRLSAEMQFTIIALFTAIVGSTSVLAFGNDIYDEEYGVLNARDILDARDYDLALQEYLETRDLRLMPRARGRSSSVSSGGSSSRSSSPSGGSSGSGSRSPSPLRHSLTCRINACDSVCECDSSGNVRCNSVGQQRACVQYCHC